MTWLKRFFHALCLCDVRQDSCQRGNGLWGFFKLCLVFSCMAALPPRTVHAKPGTHGRAISTWDTTRSTIAVMYHRGFILEGGSANNASYNVNFTSTTGRLSSQFGLQYMSLSPLEPEDTLHGGTISAMALYGIPMGERYSNGLPKAALSVFFGAVPALYSNGKYTYTTFPFVFGFGVELNPIRHISITPWVEGAPSFNFDSVFRYDAFQERMNEGTIDDINIEYGPNGEILDVSVDDAVVEDLIDDAVDYKMSMAFRIRGGLSVVGHIGDRLDVQVNATVVQMGNDFDAKPTICIGGGVIWAWDDAPLGILPEEKRAGNLSCSAVEARYRHCGGYHTLVEETRKDERAVAEKECEKKIVVHDESKETDKAVEDSPEAGSIKPLSPSAVGVSASALESTSEAAPPGDAIASEPATAADGDTSVAAPEAEVEPETEPETEPATAPKAAEETPPGAPDASVTPPESPASVETPAGTDMPSSTETAPAP